MTHLEFLIQEQVSRSVMNTLSRTTDAIAEELAHEILKDPDFRQQLRTIIKHSFSVTLAQLAEAHEPE